MNFSFDSNNPSLVAATAAAAISPKQSKTEVNLNKEDLSFKLNSTSMEQDKQLNVSEEDPLSTDKTLDDCEDDDDHNITITGLIEKIVSPNKQKNATGSSSASSSKNTSPQLPIFSSTASASAQLVTTIASGSKYSTIATASSGNRNKGNGVQHTKKVNSTQKI